MNDKKGTLYTYSTKNPELKDIIEKDINNEIIKLLIVRKPSSIPKNFITIKELSPSNELFEKCTYRWKDCIYNKEEEEKLQELGSWEFREVAHIWWDLYEPEFLEEMKKMERFIKRICQRLDEGKDVIICCYCIELKFCHRLLVGENIEKRGYKVIYN